jgi:hypothetical protein
VLHCQCGAELVWAPTKQKLDSGKVSIPCPISPAQHSFDSSTIVAAWHVQQAIEQASTKKQLSLSVRKS